MDERPELALVRACARVGEGVGGHLSVHHEATCRRPTSGEDARVGSVLVERKKSATKGSMMEPRRDVFLAKLFYRSSFYFSKIKEMEDQLWQLDSSLWDPIPNLYSFVVIAILLYLIS
jgi:hypothetical protein